MHPGTHDAVWRPICAIVLIAALLGLVPAAYADPPDPTWLGGYWDDDDFDNVVILIVNACAIEAAPLVDLGPLWTVATDIGVPPLPFVPLSARTEASPRAPPVVLLLLS